MSTRHFIVLVAISLIAILTAFGRFYMDKCYIRYHSSALEARVADLERKTAMLDLPAGTMVQVLEYPIYRIASFSWTLATWTLEAGK